MCSYKTKRLLKTVLAFVIPWIVILLSMVIVYICLRERFLLFRCNTILLFTLFSISLILFLRLSKLSNDRSYQDHTVICNLQGRLVLI